MDGIKPTTDAPPEIGPVVPFDPRISVSNDRGDAPALCPPPSGSTGSESSQSASAESGEGRCVAPSPETVVVGSGRRASDVGEEMRAREAVLCAGHAAEIAHLTERLLDARKAHAAHIERLRADHAFELRWLVEALWVAQDVARAALAQSGFVAEEAAVRPMNDPPSTVSPQAPDRPAWLNGTEVARVCGLLRPTKRLRSAILQTWRRARARFGPVPW